MFWHGRQMSRRLSEDVCAAGVGVEESVSAPVTEQDVAWLPEAAQRYLLAMGVVGRPRDCGMTVTARVFLDRDGRPANFVTFDRYADLKSGLVQAEWTTPIDGWQADGDRFVFTRGHAIWNMPQGPLDYLDFTLSPGDVRHNVAPADIAPAS